MSRERAAEFLYRVKAEPEILPFVGAALFLTDREMAQAMTARSASGQPCALCGEPAATAVTVETTAGRRWLDMCWADYADVRIANGG